MNDQIMLLNYQNLPLNNSEEFMHTPKKYLSLRYAIPEECSDMAASAFAELPFCIGIYSETDVTVAWLNFISTTDINLTIKIVNDILHKYSVSFEFLSTEIVSEENWNQQWEEQIEPMWVNENLVITPSWKADTVLAKIKIIINPQMSFGTGHHETTRLVAGLLQSAVKPQSHWVDAGTGTGVLAIVALRYGAAHVFAFDFDEWSVSNAIENFALNAVPSNMYTIQQADVSTLPFPQCNGIAANLHKNLLINSFARFYKTLQATHGTLLVSGLLRYDEQEVLTAAQQQHFTHVETVRENDWIAIHFQA